MDVGVFQRNRVVLLLWVAVPAVLFATAYGVARHWLNAAEGAVRERQRIVHSLPVMLRTETRARDTIRSLDTETNRRLSAPEGADGFVRETAAANGFELSAVQVEQGVARAGDAVRSLTIDVEGRGTLATVLVFARAVLGADGLLLLQEADLRRPAMASPLYEVRFRFRANAVSM